MTEQYKIIKFIAELSIDKASGVFSKMLRCDSSIELSHIGLEDVTEFSKKMFEQNSEITGAFVGLVSDTPLKFLYWVDLDGALLMSDLFMRKDPGTTKEFNACVSGTIQEIGNILSSSIANCFSNDFGVSMKPTPPEVFSEYSGVIFGEVMQEVAKETDEITIIETVFKIIEHEVHCSMFVLPEPGAIEMLESLKDKM